MLTIETDAGLRDIANQLDGLPLALATAGSYLFQTSMPASKYLQHHETSWLELQRTTPHLLSYEDQTIYTTWNISYIHIRKANMSAAKLLEFWAYFDNNDVWYDLLKAGNENEAPDWFCHVVGSELAFEAAVRQLQNHALVERSKDSHGYSMHHCVHAWVKSVISKTIDDHNIRLALACVGKTIPVQPTRDDWIIQQRLLLHSERCVKLMRHWDEEGRATGENELCIEKFLSRVGCLYSDQGRLMEAETTILRALDICEKVYGSSHVNTLRAASILAIIYYKQGRLTEAVSMHMRTSTVCEDTFGPDHKFTLYAVSNLASFKRQQGKSTEAELLYQQVLKARQRMLGSDYESVVEVSNLGCVYIDQGKLKEAEILCQRALMSYEETLGEDHKLTLDTVNDLGRLYVRQGRVKEAESMYQRALTSYERTIGRDHKSALDTAVNLGMLYQNLGKLTEAESMYQRALMGYEKTFGPDHWSILHLVNRLGSLYLDQRKLAEAESMLQRVLKGKEIAFGLDHLSTLGAINNMGVFYLDQGRLKEAESMFLRALRGYTRNSPPYPKEQLYLLYNIGLLYQKLQKFEKAKDFFNQAHDGSQKLLGSQHDDTIRALNALNQLNESIEREKQGARSHQRSRPTRRLYERRVIFPWRRRL